MTDSLIGLHTNDSSYRQFYTSPSLAFPVRLREKLGTANPLACPGVLLFFTVDGY